MTFLRALPLLSSVMKMNLKVHITFHYKDIIVYSVLELELDWFIFHRKNVFTLKKKYLSDL